MDRDAAAGAGGVGRSGETQTVSLDAVANARCECCASPLVDAKTGQMVFEHQACINCHTIAGTVANGRFGPDLTHLMSRDTIGAGVMPNTQQNLMAWITDPNDMKPGCLMPAMHLTEDQNAQITAYLITLQ